ncbi:MAG: hypothetical protein A2Y80_02900 [Deltaproteobacteria bacterium RBG_13_58_19]|nr:MAG: hypothetical protein A2Y80_02900 [Deltaproteobacteria bacterium RBG_13_58_19]
MKNIRPGYFWLAFLLLGLALEVPVAAAADLSPTEEAALYSLADLGPVDLSPKTVQVEVFFSPAPEVRPFLRQWAWVWPKVQQFYARMGVNLVEVQNLGTPGPLAPAQRLRLEALSHTEWLARSFKAFKVDPPFRLRFLKVCENKYAFAHLPLSVVHISVKRFQEEVCSPEPGQERQNSQWLANLLIHELGHLLGLYHAHEFINDPIGEFLPDGKTPNFMSHNIACKGEMGFVEWQKRLVHSYLGHGKVFQQYRQVDFDPLEYLEMIKLHNGYREAKSERSEGRAFRSVALGDFDEEEDNEED